MKDIRIGFIGLGGRGYGLLEWAVLPQKEQVVAVCDVYEDRVQKGAELVEKFGQARPAAYTDYHDVMKDDVLKWFTGLRVKKLRLVTRDELIKYFGEETLNVARRDAYVQGEYYDMRGVRVQEQDCTSGEWGDC